MNMKRILAVLIAASLLFTSVAGLAEDQSADLTSEPETETEDESEETEEPETEIEAEEIETEARKSGKPAAASAKMTADTSSGTARKVRVAILSDIHYVVDNTTSEAGEANLEKAANTEIRLMQEIDGILGAALDEASAANPDVLLVCGDLVSNGEYVSAIAASGVAITITFGGLRVVIPAGANLRAYADANGSVCVVCIAEAFGYENL